MYSESRIYIGGPFDGMIRAYSSDTENKGNAEAIGLYRDGEMSQHFYIRHDSYVFIGGEYYILYKHSSITNKDDVT